MKTAGFTVIEVLLGILIASVVFTSLFVLYEATLRGTVMTSGSSPAEGVGTMNDLLDEISSGLRYADLSDTNDCKLVAQDGALSFCTLWQSTNQLPQRVHIEYRLEDASLLRVVKDGTQANTNMVLEGMRRFEAVQLEHPKSSSLKGVGIEMGRKENNLERKVWIPGSREIETSFQR